MSKPRIRVTQLEAFRRLTGGDAYSYIDEEDVIDSITHKFPGNNQTRIGTAFHAVVQEGGIQPLADCGKAHAMPADERIFSRYYKVLREPRPAGWHITTGEGKDDYAVLDDRQVGVAAEYAGLYPQALHEVRVEKDYNGATVTGCADIIDGLTIRDIKTKFSGNISDEDYRDSAQWRFYLSLFDLDEFHFDLFAFEGYLQSKHYNDVRGLDVVQRTPSITCYRYPRMDDDNAGLVDRFMEWAELRHLVPYLTGELSLRDYDDD